MSSGSGAGSNDKLGVFLLGVLAGMAALSFMSEKPKSSRRYEEYQREKQSLKLGASPSRELLSMIPSQHDSLTR